MRLAAHPLTLLLSSTTLATCRAFRPAITTSVTQTFGIDRPSGVKRMSTTTPVTSSRTENDENRSGNLLRVALCQFKVTDNKETNHATCQKFIERAAKEGAKLIVLPEIWASPYATAAFPDYAEQLPSVMSSDADSADNDDTSSSPKSPSAEVLREASVKYGVWIVGGSIAEKEDDKIYNTCLVFNPQGQVVAKHRKVHLFDINVPGGITFYESDTLSPGQSLTDFDTPWCKIGVGICYDIRFAAYAMLLQQRGCRILIYPGAFNMTTGPAHWELLQRARALDNQCFVLTASPARTVESSPDNKYPHYTAWGHSTAVSPWGQVLATTNEQEDVVVVDLDLAKVDEIRNAIPISKQQRTDLYHVVAT